MAKMFFDLDKEKKILLSFSHFLGFKKPKKTFPLALAAKTFFKNILPILGNSLKVFNISKWNLGIGVL